MLNPRIHRHDAKRPTPRSALSGPTPLGKRGHIPPALCSSTKPPWDNPRPLEYPSRWAQVKAGAEEGITLSDGEGQGERAPTRRSVRPSLSVGWWFLLHRTGGMSALSTAVLVGVPGNLTNFDADEGRWRIGHVAELVEGRFRWRVCEAEVASLPVMTETGLTGDFDDIVTGWRLCRELCERHLGGLARLAWET
jgi:hypothetical protein